MLLGEKISKLRKSKGISQELLAENSRISLRTIQRIESGASTPRPYTLKVIADALGVPVDQLNLIESSQLEVNRHNDDLAKLHLINLATLAVFILPLTNIILPLIIWRKNRSLPMVNVIGRRIISFQILWTLGAFLMLVCTQLFLIGLTGSVAIGRFPPTILLVYFVLLTVNFLFIIRAAFHLSKEEYSIYSFVPVLF